MAWGLRRSAARRPATARASLAARGLGQTRYGQLALPGLFRAFAAQGGGKPGAQLLVEQQASLQCQFLEVGAPLEIGVQCQALSLVLQSQLEAGRQQAGAGMACLQ
ncbi:hypothetical protein ACFSHR_07920 [Azotobacter chroococcum]